MKRRRGVRMAFLLFSLCAGLAGVASGHERVSSVLDTIGAKIPFATVESPGVIPTEAKFDPRVMIAGLPLSGGSEVSAKQMKKSAPEMVIFGPGGNGPDIDLALMHTKSERRERPKIKKTSLVVVHDSDDPTGRR